MAAHLIYHKINYIFCSYCYVLSLCLYSNLWLIAVVNEALGIQQP